MRILAIDGSTKSTGVAVFDNDNLIYYNCITASSTKLFRRITKMIEEITKILDEYKIEKVYMEDVLPDDVKGNRKVFKALMYLQAEVAELMENKNIELVFKYPSEWRAACNIKNGRGIKRDFAKEFDIAFVKEKFNIEANDDICDAICLGYAASIEKQPIILEGGFELA